MKKGNVYRFSLQFSADTEPGICAGELLERLGNKKSALVARECLGYHRDQYQEF